jgi:rare lipoprotein A
MKVIEISLALCLLMCFSFGESLAQTGYKEKGRASYYANKFNGRKTANGEIFDNRKLTGAHKTLKFNSMVRVTNLSNNKSVVIRINDRGPYAHNRIIDLSRIAAEQIDLVKVGTAQVRIEVIGENGKVEADSPTEPTETTITTPAETTTNEAFLTGKTYSLWGTQRYPKGVGIQVGSYEDLDNAKDLTKSVLQAGFEEVYIQVGWSDKRVYRVLVGAFAERSQAENFRTQLKSAGFEGFVKKHFD